MSDTKLKPLYMAKSLEELNKKIGGEKIKLATPKTLSRLVEKIFLKARDAQLSGDEEQAYVLFMRVADAFNNIRKSRDYKTSKKEFDALLPSSRAVQALDTAGILSESLQERYSALAGPSGKKIKLSDSSDDPVGKNEDQVVPSPSSLSEPLSASDVYKQAKNAPLVPLFSKSEDEADMDLWFGKQTADTAASESSRPPTLTPQQLYGHLQRAPDEVLVLDCRPRVDFLASHVDSKKFPQWLCVPEETVKKGVTTESVCVFLNTTGKKQWKERDKKEVVVLVDEGSTAEGLAELSDSVPILALKDAITKWDISVQLAQEPLILEGGYSLWYLTYSPLCVGKPKRKEKPSSEDGTSGQADKEEVSVDYPSFPSLSDAEPPKDGEQPPPSQSAAGTEPQTNGPTSPTTGSQPELTPRPVPATPTDSPAPLQAPPISTNRPLGVLGSPTVPLPSIFPSYGPPPPLPSAIPVALTLEGEAALLTPSLSSDDNLIFNTPRSEPSGIRYPGMEQYPMAGMEQYPMAGMEPYPMTGMEQYPANGMEPLPTADAQGGNFQHISQASFPVQSTPHPVVSGEPFQAIYYPLQQPQNFTEPASNSNMVPTSQGYPNNALPLQNQGVAHQVQEPGYIPTASGLEHTGMPPHQQYQEPWPLQQGVDHPESGNPSQVANSAATLNYTGPQNYSSQQPQAPPVQQQQPHPPFMQQEVQPHPPAMQHTQWAGPTQHFQPHPSGVQPGQIQPHPSHEQQFYTQLQPYPSDMPQGQMQPQVPTMQPHPPAVQQPAIQPQAQPPSMQQPAVQLHPPPIQQPAVQSQPHPSFVQQPAVQPHPSMQQQPQPHPRSLQQHMQQQPQPHPPSLQQHMQQPHPSMQQQPQPHPPSLQQHMQQPHPSMQQPATQSQPHPPPMQQHFLPQPHPPEVQQHHNQPHPSQMGPPPTSTYHESNPRIAQGSIPNPPSYNQALHLPSHPPVQPPIPPPVSQLNQPVQPNQFVQNEQHPEQGASQEGISDLREAKIMEMQKLLDERISALESQKRQVPEDGQQLQHEQETRSIQEMREQLECERESLAREKEQHQLELEQERAQAQNELQQQKELVSEAIARERQELAAEKERHQREVKQQQRQFVALREQFEREKAQVIQKQEEMKHWELHQRQEESQRHFTLSQGLPAGWEKRLDRATGRFYYVDHGTHTTHWNPPTNWLTYQAEAQRQKELQEQKAIESGTPSQSQRQVQPQVHPGSVPHQVGQSDPVSVPRSVSQPGPQTQLPAGDKATVASPQQPPLSQPGFTPVSTVHTTPVPTSMTPGQQGIQQRPTGTQGPSQRTQSGMEPIPRQPGPTPTPAQRPTPPPTTPVPPHLRRDQKPAMPTVDRSTKPRTQPTVDRSVKPMTMADYRKKLENLQPVFGSVGHALTGLRNLGNTCFMSSVLQCLCGTTHLVTHFLSGRFRKDINRSNPLGMRGEIAEEFNFLIKNMWCGEYRSIAPRDFKFTISKFAPQFSGNAQQDSQEFLAFLLDGLHEDLNRIREKRYIEEKDNHGIHDSIAAEMAWKNHKKRNDSIIVDLFQGQFRSTVMCLVCHQRSVTFEAFMYLSIPIPSGAGGCRVEDCIRLFTKEERVSGSDKWFCSRCNAHREASKRIEIWKLPPILLIHLKRFSFEGMWRQKKQNFVDFPLNSLDMSNHVVGMKPQRQYHLYGVSNHYGTMSGGHYTAYCINPYKKKFYCFDDHEVKDIAPRQVKSAAAYLLFYASVDFTPPRIFSSPK